MQGLAPWAVIGCVPRPQHHDPFGDSRVFQLRPAWPHTHDSPYLASSMFFSFPSLSSIVISAHELLLCSPFFLQQIPCLGLRRSHQALVLRRGCTSHNYLTLRLPRTPTVPGRAHHKKEKLRTPRHLETSVRWHRAKTTGPLRAATAAQQPRAVGGTSPPWQTEGLSPKMG